MVISLAWIALVFSSVLFGICVTLLVQFYFLRRCFYNQEKVVTKTHSVTPPFQLPQTLLDVLRCTKTAPTTESCIAVNVLLQFLFHELRDTERVRKWFRNKLSLEFEELLKRTAIGRVFGNIKIRDITLGTEFPIINNITVQDVVINKDLSHIDSVDFKLDVNYCGGFQLVIDANMMLGKAAYLSVKVVELIGEGRLQFTRLPYSHWSFTFYNEPKLQLEVESQLQGRPLPQITALISSQIRKSLRKKHTLPNFKLRYKPFFSVTDDSAAATAGYSAEPGLLQLVIHQVSRLSDLPPGTDNIFCVAAVDSLPWVEMVSHRDTPYHVLDLVITKRISQQLGLSFRQELVEDKGQTCVVVEAVSPDSPAALGDAQPGDIVLAVDGKKVTTLGQAPKLIRAAAVEFTLRVERRAMAVGREDVMSALGLAASTGLRRRKRSTGADSDSSGSSPAASATGSPARSGSKRNSPAHGVLDSGTAEDDDSGCRCMRTRSVAFQQVMVLDEVLTLNVMKGDLYLNVNVRASCSSSKDKRDKGGVLMGYVNIPLSRIHSSGDPLKSLQLKPPDCFAASNSRSHKLHGHNGFIPLLCYGDVLLTARHVSPTGLGVATPPLPSPVAPTLPLLSDSSSTGSSAASSRPTSGERRHDFVRTHFSSSTQCEFCGKKIWLKDAERCRECGMTCHKKCVAKCKGSTVCAPRPNVAAIIGSATTASQLVAVDLEMEGSPRRHSEALCVTEPDDGTRRSSIQPEIITTTAEEAVERTPQPTPKKGLGGLLASVASAGKGLKRVGSANNLSLPGGSGGGANHSKSLPPSPQQTPAPSRKPSLPLELSEDISILLQGLMQGSCEHEDLMDFAKASGKTLYEDLDLPERKHKIHEMINKLKAAIDSESETRITLSREEQSSADCSHRTKAAFLIGKSDEKTQSLAVLMLHLCAGLQHIQDVEEHEREMLLTTDMESNTSTL